MRHALGTDRTGIEWSLFRVTVQPRGIEVDEQTALLVEKNGSSTVVGSGFVYFMKTPGAPEVCAPKTPLTYRNVDIYRMDSRGAFDLPMWSGLGGTSYKVSAVAGVMSSTQAGGSIY